MSGSDWMEWKEEEMTDLFPRSDAPLGAAVDDVAKLLRDGRRLRAEGVVHLEHVAAAVPHLLDAVHRASLEGVKGQLMSIRFRPSIAVISRDDG